ncbi:MAG: tetratricopeptide repeat protein, partial [Bacteroidota bacterium]
MNRALYLLLCFPLWLGITPASAQSERVLDELGRNIEQGAQRLTEMIDHYTQGLRFQPNNFTYYNNRAAAYFDQGKYRLAILDYNQAIQLAPRSKTSRLARMHYKRGLARYILQDYESAVQDFSAAVSFRPDITDSYYFRGKVNFLMLGEVKAAEQDFERVIELSDQVSIQAAFSHYFLGETSEAAEQVRKLLATTPASDKPAFAQLHYNLAGLQGLIGNGQDAVEYLSVALEYGYEDYEWLIRDPNFQGMAGQQTFNDLLQQKNLSYLLLPTQAQYSQAEPCNCPGPSSTTLPDPTPPSSTPTDPSTRGVTADPWSTGNQPIAPADLKGTQLRFEDPNDNNRIEVEETTYIELTVINQGQGEAREVLLKLQEENGLRGLTFEWEKEVGNLASGEMRTVKVPVRGDLELETGEAAFRLTIEEENGFDADPLMIHIPTLAYQPPILAVADHQFASELGGNMRPGVPLTLKMAIQNTGQGIAEAVMVNMSLPENVFTAGASQFSLGDLQPGQSEVIDFEFFTNRRFAEAEVPVSIAMTERRGLHEQKAVVAVSLNQPLAVMDRVIITPKAGTPTDIEDIQLTSDVDQNLPYTGRSNPNGVAVVIGNRDYQNPDVPPVDFALQDAASMKRYLVEVYGFDENNILYLPNATQADFNGIFGTKEDHKARLFNLIQPDQTDLFIFYSGHGAPDLESEEA